MKKTVILFLIYGIIIASAVLAIKYFNTLNNEEDILYQNTETNLTFNTTNNEQVITTNSNSTIRIINYYDETMFKGKNTILFMWASWCPNCATEMSALNDVLKKYKDDEDVNIVFIAHEYKLENDSLTSLLNLLESGTIDFNTEILVDFNRVIRKQIDPEEGYIPRTYFLDKECNVLEEIEQAVTFEQVEQLINKYYKTGE